MRKKKVIWLSSNSETKGQYFPSSKYDLSLEKSSSKLKQKLNDEKFDLIMISGPLSGESCIQIANEAAAVFQIPVLLAVPGELYDQASYQCQEHPVFVILSPLQKLMTMQAIALIGKFSDQIRLLEKQIQKEQQKFKDEKMINLCKLKLIETYHWSEEKAHSFIGKKAMDHSCTKVYVAKVLLNRLQANT